MHKNLIHSLQKRQTKVRNLLSNFALAFALLSSSARGYAQGTGFTYQGSLLEADSPANGNYELRFTLHDAAVDGSQIGAPLTLGSVGVTKGMFSAGLDFGSAPFNGAARWLQVGVRSNGTSEPFLNLVPRQLITAAPYALMARTVPDGSITSAKIATGAISSQQLGPISRLSAPDGEPANAVLVDPNGNVGIGTTEVPQQLNLTGGIGFVNHNASDKKLYSPNDGVLEWMTHDFSAQPGFAVSHQGEQRVLLSASGSSFLNGGSVGIGTSNPQAQLDVAGTTRTMNLQLSAGAAIGSYVTSTERMHFQTENGNAIHLNPGGGDVVVNAVTPGNLRVNGPILLTAQGHIVFADGSELSSAVGLVDIPVQINILTPGASSWTVPAGVSRVRFRIWGGGGGGSSEGGGGSGAFAQVVVVGAVAGEVFDLTVGSGGAPNVDGTPSRVVRRIGSATLAIANGGRRGVGQTGGAGGTATVGQIRSNGGAGDEGTGGSAPASNSQIIDNDGVSFGSGGDSGYIDLDFPEDSYPPSPGTQGYILIEY